MNELEAAREAMRKPENYSGAINDLVEQGWGQVFGRHRDSDNLSISNYETILQRFAERYELNSDYRVEGSSHWAVGWTDAILVRVVECSCEDPAIYDATSLQMEPIFRCETCGKVATITKIFREACEIADALENYPVLDDEDYYRREYDDLLEYIENELHYAMGQADLSEAEMDRVTPEKVFRYLFDNYSVSRIDDLETEWIIDAVKEVAHKPATDEEIERSFDAYR